eukprot:3601518-Rhodomonas_salina.2
MEGISRNIFGWCRIDLNFCVSCATESIFCCLDKGLTDEETSDETGTEVQVVSKKRVPGMTIVRKGRRRLRPKPAQRTKTIRSIELIFSKSIPNSAAVARSRPRALHSKKGLDATC